MITVEEAFAVVMSGMPRPVPAEMPAAGCAGRVLAEGVLADMDMPPFDRAAMDGFALGGEGPLYGLLPAVHAGDPPSGGIGPGEAVPIMTGAPVPGGADRVAMVEHSQVGKGEVEVFPVPGPGANICFRGEDIREGDLLLSPGTLLCPRHLGIAAMAGRDRLTVLAGPAAGLVTTGNEVVPPSSRPGPGEVRNANMIIMETLLTGQGFPVSFREHVGDDRDILLESLRRAIDSSGMLLVAGGVSMGARDYVPGVLEELGVEFGFGSVAQKPGKPLKFGRTPSGVPVFGLPGNPVSVLVCIEEYVLPALRHAWGFSAFGKRDFTGTLSEPVEKGAGRTAFARVRVSGPEGGRVLSIPATSGSGDLMSTRDADALAILDSGRTAYATGESVRYHLLSSVYGGAAFG